MKTILPFIFLLIFSPCFAQPTGHQRIFLEITDKGNAIPFESCFRKSETGRKIKLRYKNYQLLDIGTNKTGFQLYTERTYIHKTLMTKDHHIQIVKNKTDTMNIEIFDAFRVYFLSIPFQKGNFKLYVNDGNEHKWEINNLPVKEVKNEQIVYDITPGDWSMFKINNSKTKYDYFIAKQFAKQKLGDKPIIPEDDPGFRNQKRIRKEVADYNFDGQNDYREQKKNDTTNWNYFIYNNPTNGYVLDTLLSNLDYCQFDFEKKTFIGSKSTRVNSELTEINRYTFMNGQITLVWQMQCVHAFPNSEKMDCSVYKLENGKLVFKELIKGAE